MFTELLIVSAQRAKWQLFIFHFAASTKRAVEVGNKILCPICLTLISLQCIAEFIRQKNKWWFLRPLIKKETLLHVKPQIGFPSFELMFNKPVEYSTDWVTQSNLMLQKLQHTNLLAASCSSKSSSSWNLKYLQIQHSMKRYCFFILFGFLRATHDRYKLDSGFTNVFVQPGVQLSAVATAGSGPDPNLKFCVKSWPISAKYWSQ